jgi:hypothetical protein
MKTNHRALLTAHRVEDPTEHEVEWCFTEEGIVVRATSLAEAEKKMKEIKNSKK